MPALGRHRQQPAAVRARVCDEDRLAREQRAGRQAFVVALVGRGVEGAVGRQRAHRRAPHRQAMARVSRARDPVDGRVGAQRRQRVRPDGMAGVVDGQLDGRLFGRADPVRDLSAGERGGQPPHVEKASARTVRGGALGGLRLRIEQHGVGPRRAPDPIAGGQHRVAERGDAGGGQRRGRRARHGKKPHVSAAKAKTIRWQCGTGRIRQV